jgi:hypothetical protein
MAMTAVTPTLIACCITYLGTYSSSRWRAARQRQLGRAVQRGSQVGTLVRRYDSGIGSRLQGLIKSTRQNLVEYGVLTV